jgi:PTS system nitrogen regulatory IIA component
MEDKPLLTVPELASRLQLAERTVLRMVHRGEIPCLRIASQWRFIPDQIEHWLLEQSARHGTTDSGLSALLAANPEAVPVSRLTSHRNIISDLKPGDRRYVLEQLVEPLVDSGLISDADGYVAKLVAREEMLSTAVGSGVAIPHIRNPRENPPGDPVLVIGICREGTAFFAPDGEPTRLFFLVAAESDVVHLRLIARLNQFLLTPEVTDALLGAHDAADVMEILMKKDTMYPNREV